MSLQSENSHLSTETQENWLCSGILSYQIIKVKHSANWFMIIFGSLHFLSYVSVSHSETQENKVTRISVGKDMKK